MSSINVSLLDNNELAVSLCDNLSFTLTERTLKDNFIEVMSKKEAEDYFSKLIEGIPVLSVQENLSVELEKIKNCKKDLCFVDTYKNIVYDANSNIFDNISLLEFLKAYEDSEFNFITLIDAAESDCEEEFIYAQLPLFKGSISEESLIEEVFSLQMLNEDTQNYYTMEEIKEIGPYSVLLNHFTLRKDKYRIEPSLY